MASHGIKDRVAIVGMGCTNFVEHWDKGLDDLLIEAANDAYASAGIDKDDVDAYWLGTAQGGMSGITLARPLQLVDKPVTRVENFCATGAESLRQAVYAVASGAYDTAMAIGVEKTKDGGYQGLNAVPPPNDGTGRTLTAAAMFSMVAPAYAAKYGVDADKMREAMAHVAWKNHRNGARNPRAQFRREVSIETICNSPKLAGDLGVFDCAGVADGSAAAIVVRAEDAYEYTDTPIFVKALSFIAGNGGGVTDPALRLHQLPGDRRDRAATRTSRRGSPTRAASSRWPRCTTASPSPSSCSWRTSGSPSVAPRGVTSSTVSTTSTASCRSTPTVA